MIFRKFLLFSLLLFCTANASEKTQTVAGFSVVIKSDVKNKNLEKAIIRLRRLLLHVQKVAPKLYLATKDKVKIWITDAKWQDTAAAYNPSTIWLIKHGHDPRLAAGIEIINLNSFLDWSVGNDQPMMILHELTHAYHDQVIGYDNKEILSAFKKAIADGKYLKVRYQTMTGPIYSAYARTDHKEYFAEISEAYFGKNDYYPFNRAQLKTYDPAGYKLVERFLDEKTLAN